MFARFFTFLLLFAPAVQAALTIEIVGGGANQIPIAITAFKNESPIGTSQQALSQVVSADLTRSGLFRLVDVGGLALPSEFTEVKHTDFSSRGAEALVIGSVAPLADGKIEVKFRLVDVVKQTQLAALSYSVLPQQLRLTAHKIADIIYEKLTGDVGVFSTKIAYVIKQGPRYELQIADADGYNPQTIVTSVEPIISPAWSPDGSKLAYVSFEKKKPVVFVQDLNTGKRQVLANYPGSNSAPAWSPDGSKLGIVLTKDGSSQIYTISPDGSGLTRLTNSPAIDTEPNFSPDGKWILFTSDRGGNAQIYRMSSTGGAPERVTFEGKYNYAPRFSPDGSSFTFMQRNGSAFNIAIQDFVTGQVQVLTDSGFDESPSFAPNGKVILYASETGGRGVLAAVSSDGRVKQKLTVQTGDVREPAWGPLPKTN
ncbi:MAG: Tol-Pal system beta propeller repeat protein TolB [Burkholderiales bacterium]